MHVLISCKNEEDPIKNETCKSMGIFSDTQGAASYAVHVWIWLKFEQIRDVTVVLVTCKNEEDPLKNDDTRVFTTIIFSDAQGQEIRTHPSFYALPCFVQE